ncbi:unnamed protein product, partial [Ectocarpus sp. 12 AP-2014]
MLIVLEDCRRDSWFCDMRFFSSLRYSSALRPSLSFLSSSCLSFLALLLLMVAASSRVSMLTTRPLFWFFPFLLALWVTMAPPALSSPSSAINSGERIEGAAVAAVLSSAEAFTPFV